MSRLTRLARNPWARGVFVLAMLASALLAIWWRGPDWPTVYHAFDFVSWRWVVVGVLLNLLSVLARALSWRLTINQALPEPHPPFGQVFSAFGIGLLGNAVLPARAGELARVAVLRRHCHTARARARRCSAPSSRTGCSTSSRSRSSSPGCC